MKASRASCNSAPRLSLCNL
uniref:Uncharacterized protein n=1 Tax=Anguilla anguilla TaxID=7936 RepID=A0A0E9PHK8_ANGAN